MTKYFIIVCNDLQGGRYYRTEKEAQEAADRRNALMGRLSWAVRPVYLYDAYASDERPYRMGRA